MTLSDPTLEPTPVSGDLQPSDSPATEPNASMQEYYRLQQELLVITLIATAVIFGFVCFFYSLNIALNYLIGACTGVVYLRLLAKNVEQLGNSKKRVGNTRLALFIGLIVIATQLNQLQIIPIFLGFLTYKVALLVYVLRITFIPDPK